MSGAAAKALIAGAGIGGLAAAIALGRAGWEVEVLERAPEPQPIGAGLSVWPNGVAALQALGLGSLCDPARGVPRTGGALRRSDGSELAGFDPAALEARYGRPLVGLHRADLLAGLLEAAGPDRVRWGAEIARAGDGSVHLADGTSESADLIVGADGIHSVVRASRPGPAPPRDSGIVAWRGVVPLPEGGVPAGEWWAPRTVAGLLPLVGGRVYWYLAYHGEEGDRAELARRAALFAEPVPGLIAATGDEVLSHRLYDRDPARGWSEGAVTLLGDAAHPMLPFLGQGACSALEDAVALGELVPASSPDLSAALTAYERSRFGRTAALVKGSRRAASLALAGSGAARAVRDALVGLVPASLRMRQLDAVVGPGIPGG